MTATLSPPETRPQGLSAGVPDGAAQREIDRRRGRFVPWVIAAFYLTFMSALIGFVVIAYQHPPNETTPQAYEKGLAYNTTLEKGAAQAQSGWSSQTALRGEVLSFTLRDRQGRPVDATVRAWFVHPSRTALDRNFALRQTAPGHFGASVNLPSKGLWTLHITAASGANQYQSVTQVQVD